MIRKTLLAAALLLAVAACGSAPTDVTGRPEAGAASMDSIADSTAADTTGRGGGTLGSGT